MAVAVPTREETHSLWLSVSVTSMVYLVFLYFLSESGPKKSE